MHGVLTASLIVGIGTTAILQGWLTVANATSRDMKPHRDQRRISRVDQSVPERGTRVAATLGQAGSTVASVAALRDVAARCWLLRARAGDLPT